MTEDKKYKIIHDRDICIGCSACASVCPKYWVMDSDGKSSIVGHTKTGNGEEEILGTNESPLDVDFEANMDAAESCPVNCIHIHEVDENNNDKELI